MCVSGYLSDCCPESAERTKLSPQKGKTRTWTPFIMCCCWVLLRELLTWQTPSANWDRGVRWTLPAGPRFPGNAGCAFSWCLPWEQTGQLEHTATKCWQFALQRLPEFKFNHGKRKQTVKNRSDRTINLESYMNDKNIFCSSCVKSRTQWFLPCLQKNWIVTRSVGELLTDSWHCSTLRSMAVKHRNRGRIDFKTNK